MLAAIIGSTIIFAYKWNAKRVRDHLKTQKELNEKRRGIVLPDFGPNGERVTRRNPLFQEEVEERYVNSLNII